MTNFAIEETRSDSERRGMVVAGFSDLLDRLAAEEKNNASTLHLTANENALSALATRLMSGPLYGRYHLGHANKREIAKYGTTFLGLVHKSLYAIHELEQAACRASANIFGARYSDFRPLSGVHAIIATLAALTSQNDNVYCLRPNEAGHFATADIIERLGRRCHYLPWNNEAADLDLEGIETAFLRYPPDCIYLDHSASLFPLSLKALRAICGDGVVIVYDASHPLGLIAGGAFPNPLELGADVLQGNTHKSFPGPQKALILTNSQQLWERLNKTLNTFVSSQHSGDTLALYITVLEMEAFGQEYARQVTSNARTLSCCLAERGFGVFPYRNGAACSHQFFLDGFAPEASILSAYKLLSCGISVNAKTALGRNVIRAGVQEVTRKGMKEREMAIISEFFERALRSKENPDAIRRDVAAFVGGFKRICFSFDSTVGL